MVDISVAGASRQSRYPTLVGFTVKFLFKSMKKPVQLGIICGMFPSFLRMTHMLYKKLWSAKSTSRAKLSSRDGIFLGPIFFTLTYSGEIRLVTFERSKRENKFSHQCNEINFQYDKKNIC